MKILILIQNASYYVQKGFNNCLIQSLIVIVAIGCILAFGIERLALIGFLIACIVRVILETKKVMSEQCEQNFDPNERF